MPAEPDVVEAEVAAGVMTVTMVDEARRNALTGRMQRALHAAFDEAERRDDVRVVVLTNRGSTFCAGASLDERSAGPDDQAVAPRALFQRFAASPKPYVGRIAGHCVAGGMGLAAALDVAIAADEVRFGFTEVRVGVAPAIISVVCLPKLRPVDARAAFLRGNRLTASEAAAMGLIFDAVPRVQLDTAVATVVGDLLAGGPNAIAATKEVLAKVPTMAADDAFDWTEALSAHLFDSDEGREGMQAFLSKRPPRWAPPPEVP